MAAPRNPMIIPLIVACSAFMENLDTTIIVPAMPAMAETFGVGTVGMFIGITVYMVTLAAFLPASSWAADRWGARNVYCGAIIGFTVASLLCALSFTMWQFILARVLQGMAASMMSPVGRLVVLKNTEKKDLVRAIATITWPSLIAPVIGPLLGGYISTYATWHWIFLINLPIGLVGIVLVLLFIPNTRETERRPFDIRGFILTSSALASLICGIDMLSHAGGAWRDAAASIGISLVLIAAGLGLGALGVRHMFRFATPLVHLGAHRIHTFAVAVLWGGSLSRIAIGATPVLLPMLFQVGFGMTAFDAGKLVFAYFIGNLAMKTVTTPVLRHFGFRVILIGNGIILSAAIAACALLADDTPLLLTMALLFVNGCSRSMQFTALNTLSFADIAGPQKSAATTLAGVSMQISMSFGIALAAVLSNVSLMLRGGETTGLIDFRVAFVAVAAIGALGLIRYFALPPDAGTEVSGHKPRLRDRRASEPGR